MVPSARPIGLRSTLTDDAPLGLLTTMCARLFGSYLLGHTLAKVKRVSGELV